ncbi:hypothetical protein [Clostridium scatologenes]|uniref:Uncharacterized protein n=1 Tax=Clostridium scatologenes TaxID=1548 RepID=A0A0E3K4G3_CLOSL|nr:hypothetical protein [Clostridium scatologenes]AKA71968.1 hypothetical protein CSCA_4843 [Clostridium scatologenes]
MKLQCMNVIRIVNDEDKNIINKLKDKGFNEIDEDGKVVDAKEDEIEREVEKRVEEIKKELEKEMADKAKSEDSKSKNKDK